MIGGNTASIPGRAPTRRLARELVSMELGRLWPWWILLGSWILVTTWPHLIPGIEPVLAAVSTGIGAAWFAFAFATVSPDSSSRKNAFLRTRPLPRNILWNVRLGLLGTLPALAVAGHLWILARLGPSGWPHFSDSVAAAGSWTLFAVVTVAVAYLSRSWTDVILLGFCTPFLRFPIAMVLSVQSAGMARTNSIRIFALLLLVDLVVRRRAGWTLVPARVLGCIWGVTIAAFLLAGPLGWKENEAPGRSTAPILLGLEPVRDPEVRPRQGSWLCLRLASAPSGDVFDPVRVTSAVLIDGQSDPLIDIQPRRVNSLAQDFLFPSRSTAWTQGKAVCLDRAETDGNLGPDSVLPSLARSSEGFRWRLAGHAEAIRENADIMVPLSKSRQQGWAPRSGWSFRARLDGFRARGSQLTATLAMPYRFPAGSRNLSFRGPKIVTAEDLVVRWVGPEQDWEVAGLVQDASRHGRRPNPFLAPGSEWTERPFELVFVAPHGQAADLIEGSTIELYEIREERRAFVAESPVGNLEDWVVRARDESP